MNLTSLYTFMEQSERDMVALETLLTSIPALAPEAGGQGEFKKCEALTEWLLSHGLTNIERFEAPDSRVESGVRPSIVVTVPGASDDFSVWIMAHTDVVAAGEKSLWDADPWTVVEKDGKLIGQNIFVRAMIKADNGSDVPIMTMGPICITPALQRKGYGKILLDYSLEKAKELGCGAVCFEGNIDFYSKSGFSYASAYGIRYHGLPEGADTSFFLCKELIPGYLSDITGEYAAPKGYSACDEYPNEFAVYEAGFPYKEKRKLSGQIFD